MKHYQNRDSRSTFSRPFENHESRMSFMSTFQRPSAESIRIYAGEDIYALLADVEGEIAEMERGVNGGGELLMPSQYIAESRL